MKLIKCKRPKMTGNKGTWDVEFKIINEEKVVIHYDTTWGKYGYFMLNNLWYKISVFEFDNIPNNPNGYEEYFGKL